MEISPAEVHDLNQCYYLSGDYTTDYVWQLQSRNSGHRTDIRFDRVRLPRPMQVAYPRSPDELLAHWQQEGCFLVARTLHDDIVGYLDALPQPGQKLLWIHNLIVAKAHRQQGVGALLFNYAKSWAGQHQLNNLLLEVQTKNHPAISFAQQQGCQFSGFNERYFANGDIALFFHHTF